MKWYGIDEDIYVALVDLLGEAKSAAKHVGDEDSVTYYSFLLGELEDAKKYNNLGKGRVMNDEQTARMMKLQRYLRMLQDGLKDPKDRNKKKRRQLARDVIEEPNPKKDIIDKVSMEEVEEFLKDDPELTNFQRFELYYDERNRRKAEEEAKNAKSLDETLEELGIEPYKPNRDKKS